jgi:hypothetical protein
MSVMKIGLCGMMMFGIISATFAQVPEPTERQARVTTEEKLPVPTEPYGTPAEQQQCIDNLEASLDGQSPLGSRDGSEYIQDLGELYSEGYTEYDVLDDRCRRELYDEYRRAHGDSGE